MVQFIHSPRVRASLLFLRDLVPSFQASSGLAYLTTAIGLLLVVFWFGRLHMRLLAKNKQLQLRLNKIEAKELASREAAAAIQGFLTRITHEIRIPMNGIISFAALALKTDLATIQREYLDRVLISAEWLTHVISDVLDFTRMESLHLELNSKSFCFANCVLSAIKMMEPSAGQKHLELTYRVDPRIPHVLNGDPDRLRQVIVNLLENAIRYTTNGSVVLSATIVSETDETIKLSIAVADTGIGIRQEDQVLIFQPFQTAANIVGDGRSGAGLGLSICKRLVETMGGSIEVQAQIGAGSTFRFSVPLDKVLPEAESLESADLMSKLTLKRLSILLADENVLSRRLTIKLLESVGHQISPASTAGEAINLFSTDIFDLVLMSSELPDMQGLSLAQALRELEDEAAGTQLFVLRAAEDAIDADTYLATGIDGVVPRPVQVEQLLRMVQGACSAQAALERSR